eukprot:TRINITY_DN25913_c0_g2_i2.p1 TRINITY_DN25913_c0_g2~~TRINITY_DN25913_c0_g2_i2.p1  ORF type:complete len:550 (-),score=99.32 TRINITY_DN25913_c0_g2_i2:64-1713(-)
MRTFLRYRSFGSLCSVCWSDLHCDRADLSQADLDAHGRKVAEAAVCFDVVPTLVDAIDYHLGWASMPTHSGLKEHLRVPVFLPVLLSRLLCSMLAPSVNNSRIARHIQLYMVVILDVVCSFVALALTHLGSEESGQESTLALALRAVLDILLVLAGVDLWRLGIHISEQADIIAEMLLDDVRTAYDPAIMARLALLYVRRCKNTSDILGGRVGARVASLCNSFPEHAQHSFWRQLRARARLCCLGDSTDFLRQVQEWLESGGIENNSTGEGGAAAAAWAAVAAGDIDAACVFAGSWEEEAQREMQELDLLIAKCLTELPQSLREAEAEAKAFESACNGSAGRPDIASLEAAASAATAAAAAAAASLTPRAPSHQANGHEDHCAAEVSAVARATEATMQERGLGALDLPALPGQQVNGESSSSSRPRRRKKLERSDLDRIRGVDLLAAPEELRCAIDGKVVGAAVRSPHGHLFERATLGKWIGMCGSICPITGQPLRLEDCQEDQEVQRQVIEWARGSKARHKHMAEERRLRRQAEGGHDEGAPDPDGLF